MTVTTIGLNTHYVPDGTTNADNAKDGDFTIPIYEGVSNNGITNADAGRNTGDNR